MKRTAAVSISLAFAFAGTLAVEILLARGGPRLPERPHGKLDGLVGTGPGQPLRIVWIGDSTGEGIGASEPSRALPRVVASGLGRLVHLTVLAQSGARVAGALETQLPQLERLEPDWVFIGIGSNDVVHVTRRGSFSRDVERLLTGIERARPSRVVVVGVGQFASTPLFAQPLRWIAGTRARRLDRDLRVAAERHDALFVSIIDRVGAEFVRDPARFHAADRFHPSDEGYALWARATLDALREAGAA